MKILIINGPNLNLLGTRETSIYGSMTFLAYFEQLKSTFKNVDFEYFQSNHEGAIIDKIHLCDENDYQGVLLNAGAYTHTSIAIRDAIAGVNTKFIEIHISNIFSREEFRHKSYIAPVCQGSISGFGLKSYELGVIALS